MRDLDAAARLSALAAAAAAASLVDIGVRGGLFARLATRSAASCADHARALGVDVGWLRDWLDGLVVARLIDHDGARGTYLLAPAVARALEESCDIVDAHRPRVAAAAQALFPSMAALIINPAADAALIALAATPLVLTIVDAATRVADNLDHPLGAALYDNALRRRSVGGSGHVGLDELRAAVARAQRSEVETRRLLVGTIPRVFMLISS